MGVPFEALIPYGIMLAVGTLPSNDTRRYPQDFRRLDTCKTVEREHDTRWINGTDKVILCHRMPFIYNTDSAAVMDRDRRLTGYLRGQTDNPVAPAGFELNNPWRLEKRII
ncbi:hypothetical protein EG329_003625 [Mollisiaceae sp. DMI_Dod_QoI]|nr:hypothetical protein EG329_003625 [Helotiales sp. DMI_Dod_QoI]